MPARLFRYLVHNQVQGHTLRLVDQHKCGGEWTGSDWAPDGAVGTGGTAGLQAESAGVLTGTEGWVKYRLIRDSDGASRGMVYLYWNNPYLGTTRGRAVLVGVDIKPDCHADGDSGSNFTEGTGENAPPPDLKLTTTNIARNGAPSSPDELGDLAKTQYWPLIIFGTSGIWERMEVELALTSSDVPSTLPPIGPQPGKRTRSLNTSPSPQQFNGRWSDGVASVTLQSLVSGLYHVVVHDETPGAPLELDVKTWIGNRGLEAELDGPSLRQRLGQDDASQRAKLGPSAASSFLRGGGGDSTSASTSASSVAAVGDLIRGSASKDRVEVTPPVSGAELAGMARADYALYPTDGMYIALYDEFEDGRPAGRIVHYQRVSATGSVVADRYLTFRPDVR